MKAIARGTAISAFAGTPRQSCAFPGLCVLPDGRWLCSCRAAPTKGGTAGQHVLLTWSDDEGRTWSEPSCPFAPPAIGGRAEGEPLAPLGAPGAPLRPGLFRAAHLTPLGGPEVLAALCWVDHSDPSLPFFNEKTEGLLDTRIFLARSHDAGETWSPPHLMDTSPFNVPTPLTGPILALHDGANPAQPDSLRVCAEGANSVRSAKRTDRLACQFELNKPYHDTSVWRHSSVLMFSADGGRSWPEHAVTGNDPENRIFYWDQRPAVLRDGTLLDLFWTYDNRSAVYLNIHARESKDSGRTWPPLWDTGVPGQPAPPVSLPDDRIVMVYVDRTGPPAIKARLSRDRGRTWPPETELIIAQPESSSQTRQKKTMQDAWSEMSKFSLGLPTTAPLKNGDILVVYYAGPETDYTDIHWTRLQT